MENQIAVIPIPNNEVLESKQNVHGFEFESNALGFESESNASAEDQTVCRICQLSAAEAPNLGNLKQPCDCCGSMQLVHELCLLQWVRTTRRTTCEVCGKRFSIIRLRFVPIRKWRVSNDQLIHLTFSGIYWTLFGHWVYKMITATKFRNPAPWWLRWCLETILIGNILEGAWIMLRGDFRLFRGLLMDNSEFAIENIDTSRM